MKRAFLNDLANESEQIEQTKRVFKQRFGELIKSMNPRLSSALFTVQQEMNHTLSVIETRHKELVSLIDLEQISHLQRTFESKSRTLAREERRFEKSSKRLSKALKHIQAHTPTAYRQHEFENASKDEIASKKGFEAAKSDFRDFQDTYRKSIARILCATLHNYSTTILKSSETVRRCGAEIRHLMEEVVVQPVDDSAEKQQLLDLKEKYKHFTKGN